MVIVIEGEKIERMKNNLLFYHCCLSLRSISKVETGVTTIKEIPLVKFALKLVNSGIRRD